MRRLHHLPAHATPSWPIAAALMLASLLSGCSVITPVPTWELIKATGAAASVAAGQAGARATQTVYHLHAPPSMVCIEFNPDTPVADILPALQLELKSHAVDSRIYGDSSLRGACTHWLRYTAYIGWDTRLYDKQQRAYLRLATLTLSRADGRVLSQSQYDAGEGWMSGKWATTRDKLAPVVTALITGFEN